MARLLEPDEIHYTDFEPKLQNRFIMYIDGIPSYIIKTSGKPQIQFNVVTLDHMNMKRKLLGKGEWQDLSITLYDPINPSGAQSVIEWVRAGYESLTGRAGYADFYKKEIVLNTFGPPGDVIEEWRLKGAFISDANWGELDWANAEPGEISLTLSYDFAVLEF